MLGCHQLDNALTAICAILCLQEQGKTYIRNNWLLVLSKFGLNCCIYCMYNILGQESNVLSHFWLGWKVQDKAIWAGLEQTCVAGRFQGIPKADTLKLLGDQEHLALVLDGGEFIAAFFSTFGLLIC